MGAAFSGLPGAGRVTAPPGALPPPAQQVTVSNTERDVHKRSSLGFQLESKLEAALYNVEHGTQLAESGGILGILKAKYKLPFRPLGQAIDLNLAASEQTLLAPKSMKGLSASAKVGLGFLPLGSSNITATFVPSKRTAFCSFKNETYFVSKLLKTELKYSPHAPLRVESEVVLTDREKVQVETVGNTVDAIKLTVQRGRHQWKLKHILPGNMPVIGLDTYFGSQKYDLEYNVASGSASAKLKSWPMSVTLNTVAGRNGVGRPSYSIAAQRDFAF